ncbi:Tetracyclin repressor-like C-terminal domain-containing protein [Flavobacterium branchiophilum]|uniref:Tetracyclin repressor-like C-terminal domain-containing protein n=1 Tax=Flavobacterium branchiophilum (strain FL-15) TaxID=1034807 RepID=G2Z545_FLABF|nr:TetR family transcriptional regulator C-terminal domain-containing protein [Flavobacterium branchiophilum]CCB68551.1 Protein of unknown function [Flavobacterium branchiophilum FL-15]
MGAKKTVLNQENIVSMYMEYMLEHATMPKTVYEFAQKYHFEEAHFYQYFGAFESVERHIFKSILDKTVALLHQNQEYHTYDFKTKLLSFYFTYIEMLTANRSFVLMCLKNRSKKVSHFMILGELRLAFKNYVSEIIDDKDLISIARAQKLQITAIKESLWAQFMFVIQFWIEDLSPAFEKTDVLIEKSVQASFEIMSIAPWEKVIDFGKFLFKEKVFSRV